MSPPRAVHRRRWSVVQDFQADRLLAFAAALAALGSCAHMAVPADVAQTSEVIVATNRSAWGGSFANEEFILGPFRVSHVDRGWRPSGGRFSVGPYSQENLDSGYAYDFGGGPQSLTAQCASNSNNQAVGLGSGMSLNFGYATLVCRCGDDAETTIKTKMAKSYGGTMVIGTTKYTINSIHEFEGGSSSGDPSGYRVDGSDGPQGAVEVLHPGRVWIKKAVADAERAKMACLFSGLMLYHPPQHM
jgi:hypothetical protein